jgi:hypothetical protein
MELQLELSGNDVKNTYGHVFQAYEYEKAIEYLVKATRMGKSREKTLREFGSVSLNPRYHNGHFAASIEAFGTEQGK